MHDQTNLAVCLLEPNLSRHPDKTAYICNDEKVSYRQLADAACRFKTFLQEHGISAGERVLLVMLDSPVLVAAFLGTALHGAIAVPVSTAISAEEYRYILEDSGARIMLVSPSITDAAELDFPGIHRLLCNETLNGWLEGYPPAALTAVTPSNDDLAFMTYTSGTTGHPKGVPHRHNDLPHVAEQFGVKVLGITGNDLIFSTVKLYFAYGLGNCLAYPLCIGAAAVLHPGRPSPEELLKLFERHQPTMFFSVPVFYAQIVRSVTTDKLQLPFRICVSGGETLHPSLFNAWRQLTGLEILNCLGTTEACCFFIANVPGKAVAGSAGEVMPGCEVRLLDDNGIPVPAETPGNLQVRVGGAAPFYWNLPEKSAETMLPDGFMKTGDVLIEKNGYYFHQGRSDDMMKVGGQWLSPQQAEDTLLTHPAVSDCAVVSCHLFGLEFPAAHIVLKSGYAADQALEQELKNFIAEKLPKLMQPVRYFFAKNLPRTPTGKIQRYKLKQHSSHGCTTNLTVALLAHNLAKHPDKTAYICNDETVSYRQLADAACRFATLLYTLKIYPDDRVMLVLPDSPVFVAVFLGTILHGAVAVPVSTSLSKDDYRYILTDSEARIMLTSSAVPVAAECPLPEGVERLVYGETLNDWLTGIEAAPLTATDPAIDKLAFMQYTSGSTGQPKGVPHRHRDLIFVAEQYAEKVIGIREDDLIFSPSKLFFGYGLGNSLAFPLYVGATALLYPGKPLANDLLKLIETRRPSLFFSVPTIYAQIILSVPDTQLDLPMRLCISAGEALPISIINEWHRLTGLDLLDGIGTTEATHIFISNYPGRAVAGSAGQAVPGFEIRLVDDEGKDVPSGTPGHMLVRGESLATFYWKQPEKSAATMLPDGFVRTGDLFVEEGGYYYHRGRSDDMMKVGGQWISPLQVEEALRNHPAVADCAVASCRYTGLERPAAHLTLKPGFQFSAQLELELRRFMMGTLPDFMLPVRYFFVDDLPRTPTGKVQRFKLRS